MTVEIADVKRVNGKAVRTVALIGDIVSNWIRSPDTGKPYEESRKRDGVQVLDRETLRIPDSDYQELRQTIAKIFSEDRSKARPQLQGKLF